MKKSVCAVLFIVLVVFSLSSSVFAQQQGEHKKIIYQLGVAPLEKKGVNAVGELKALIIRERAVIDLLLKGRKGLVEEFYRQFDQMRVVDEMAFDKSDRIQLLAMSWRNWDKEPKITVPVELAVEGIIEAYIFKIDYMQIQKSYWFLVPKKCGNISLWKIEELKVEEKIREFPPQISEPPVQKPNPPKPSEPPAQKPKPTEPPVEIKKGSDMNFFFDLSGGLFKSCYKEYIRGRIGLRAVINDKFELNFSGGMSLPLDLQKNSSGIGWKMVFMGDVDLIYRPSALFIGIGAGMSSKMKDGTENQFEGIFVLGHQFGKVDVFAEGRVPLAKGENINNNNKFLVVLRVHL